MLDKYFKNYETTIKVEQIINSEEEILTLEEFNEQIEEYCKEPWGKTLTIELHNEDLDCVECKIEHNGYDSGYNLSVHHGDVDDRIEIYQDDIVKELSEMVDEAFKLLEG